MKVFYIFSLVIFLVLAYLERGLWGPIWWGLGIGAAIGLLGGLIGGLMENKIIKMQMFRTVFFICLWLGILIEIFAIWFSIYFHNQ